MKHWVFTVCVASVLIFVSSCTSGYESKGNSAYNAAKKMQLTDVKRKLQKEAYIYYQKAIKAHPNKISPRLRNRFVEMTLVRAEMVLTEGSAKMDALPLYMEDIDNSITASVDPAVKERYAAFLSVLADSSFGRSKLYKGLALLDKAISVADQKKLYEDKKQGIIDNFAKENYEAAEIEMINGKTNEDAESLIRAEFLCKVALLHEPDYKEAMELLSTLYKLNIGSYSAYEAVVLEKPDTAVYSKVNVYDILMAVPKYTSGSSVLLEVEIYNYSYNPLRLRPENFTVEDVNGRKFLALGSSKIEKDILDQEMETKMKLRFKTKGAKIKKLSYRSGNKDHYTEKLFL